MQSYCY